MKLELLAGVFAVVLSIPALAATQAPRSPAPQAAEASVAAATAPTLPMLANAPYVAFGLGEPGGLAPLDLNAPVTRVIVAPPPPPARVDGDDEVEPAESPPMEMSAYALMLAGVAVLLYIASRLRQD